MKGLSCVHYMIETTVIVYFANNLKSEVRHTVGPFLPLMVFKHNENTNFCFLLAALTHQELSNGCQTYSRVTQSLLLVLTLSFHLATRLKCKLMTRYLSMPLLFVSACRNFCQCIKSAKPLFYTHSNWFLNSWHMCLI